MPSNCLKKVIEGNPSPLYYLPKLSNSNLISIAQIIMCMCDRSFHFLKHFTKRCFYLFGKVKYNRFVFVQFLWNNRVDIFIWVAISTLLKRELLILKQNLLIVQLKYSFVEGMEKITINDTRYAVINMDDVYPFGGIQETSEEGEENLVRKKLHYQKEEDLAILHDMASLLQGLDCEFLIKLIHAEADTEGTCNFYYQYAPLTVSKWILDMGDDLVKELQLELMNLASFLSKNGVKFIFDPKCVGLSQDIKIKYFLNEFAMDYDNKFSNFKENEQQILQFMEQLRGAEKEEEAGEGTRETFNNSSMEHSLTGIRVSWDVKSYKSSSSTKDKNGKMKLAERLQETKRKSMDVLNRIKGLKTSVSTTRSRD